MYNSVRANRSLLEDSPGQNEWMGAGRSIVVVLVGRSAFLVGENSGVRGSRSLLCC